MANITWFKKEKDVQHSKADVTISVLKNDGASIILRNNYRDAIAPESDYLMIGVPADDNNRLVFMASDKSNGWKIYKRKKTESTYFVIIKNERIRDLCARFAGDYEMELYEDTGATLFCINRRYVL